MERAKSLRRDKKELVVTYREGKSNPAAKDIIARWIGSTIRQAYNSSNVTYCREPSAHDTRKWTFLGAVLQSISKRNPSSRPLGSRDFVQEILLERMSQGKKESSPGHPFWVQWITGEETEWVERFLFVFSISPPQDCCKFCGYLI